MQEKFHCEWEKLQHQLLEARANAASVNIPSILIVLLIVGEDHRFQKHLGVDLIALCRAVWRTTFSGRREGGSTIAMQLVRVLTGKYETTLSRKVLEIYLALRLSRSIPRNEIPAIYLSVAYFGWRMNGIRDAYKRLNIDPPSLSLVEAANIIARLKYPEPKTCPVFKRRKISARAEYIIQRYNKLLRRNGLGWPHLIENNGTL